LHTPAVTPLNSPLRTPPHVAHSPQLLSPGHRRVGAIFAAHTQVKAELGARVDELRAANGALVRQVQDLAVAKQAADGLFTELKVRACVFLCVCVAPY